MNLYFGLGCLWATVCFYVADRFYDRPFVRKTRSLLMLLPCVGAACLVRFEDVGLRDALQTGGGWFNLLWGLAATVFLMCLFGVLASFLLRLSVRFLQREAEPKWMRENEKTALRAIRRLKKQEDLEKAAKEAPCLSVRVAALERLGRKKDAVAETIDSEADEEKAREMILAIEDEETLAKVVTKVWREEHKLLALSRIREEDTLRELQNHRLLPEEWMFIVDLRLRDAKWCAEDLDDMMLVHAENRIRKSIRMVENERFLEDVLNRTCEEVRSIAEEMKKEEKEGAKTDE